MFGAISRAHARNQLGYRIRWLESHEWELSRKSDANVYVHIASFNSAEEAAKAYWGLVNVNQEK